MLMLGFVIAQIIIFSIIIVVLKRLIFQDTTSAINRINKLDSITREKEKLLSQKLDETEKPACLGATQRNHSASANSVDWPKTLLLENFRAAPPRKSNTPRSTRGYLAVVACAVTPLCRWIIS